MDWFKFCAAYLAFFLSHALPVRPRVKSRLVSALGKRGFAIAYSLLSLSVLIWLIGAAGRAPFVALWEAAIWHNHLLLVVMLAVCLIVALSLGRPNPFSFGGPDEGFDAAHPGIVRYMRHPMLVALALWSGAHLVANGALAHVLLFGGFAGFALIGQIMIDRRRKSQMGADWWAAYQQMQAAPLLQLPSNWVEFSVRLLSGLALYVALIWLHPYLFGVSPLR